MTATTTTCGCSVLQFKHASLVKCLPFISMFRQSRLVPTAAAAVTSGLGNVTRFTENLCSINLNCWSPHAVVGLCNTPRPKTSTAGSPCKYLRHLRRRREKEGERSEWEDTCHRLPPHASLSLWREEGLSIFYWFMMLSVSSRPFSSPISSFLRQSLNLRQDNEHTSESGSHGVCDRSWVALLLSM